MSYKRESREDGSKEGISMALKSLSLSFFYFVKGGIGKCITL